METGYACAIPACRQATVEIAHIVPFNEVQEHEFDNLIPLCPNHHTRYDKGEIPRTAILQYKANLAVLNGRYSDIERRFLQAIAELRDDMNHRCYWLPLPGAMDLQLRALIEDGIIEKIGRVGKGGGVDWDPDDGPAAQEYWTITGKGEAFLDRWLGAEPLL